MHNDDDYEVGYGKPPKGTRFQKGTSGNPKGRPKGSKSLATIFNQLSEERFMVPTPKRPRRMSVLEIGVMQLLQKSAKGDLRAMREVLRCKKEFGDVIPVGPGPTINVHFRSPEPDRYALPNQVQPQAAKSPAEPDDTQARPIEPQYEWYVPDCEED